MKILWSWSIRTSLIILAFLCVVPALGIMVYSGLRNLDEAVARGALNVLRMAQTMVAYQETFEAGSRQFLSALAELPAVRERNGAACNKIFVELLTRNTLFANIVAVDLNGQVFASAIPHPPASVADQKYFKDTVTSRNFSVGEYDIKTTANSPTLDFSYPIFDERKQLLGVVVASLDLSNFDRFFSMLRLPEGSSITLADHNGIILYRKPDPEKKVGGPVLPRVFRWMSGSQPEGTFTEPGWDNIVRIHAFKQLRLTEKASPYLYLRVGYPKAQVLAGGRSTLILNVILLALSLLLAVVIAWFLGKYGIINRIKTLGGAMERIKQGDQNVRVELPSSGDELGHLIRLFHEMVISLAEKEAARRQADDKLHEREQIYKMIFEQSPLGIIHFDQDSVITECNEQFCHITGAPKDKLIGFNMIKSMPGGPARGAIEDALITGSGFFEGGYHTVCGGKDIMIRARHKRLQSSEGDFSGAIGVVEDISEAKRLEYALEVERNRLSSILNNLPGYVCLVAPDFTIQFSNNYFKEAFGDPEHKLCHEVFRQSSTTCRDCPTSGVFETHESVAWEYAGPDNQIYQVHEYPFMDTDGAPMIMNLGINITDRRQAEDLLRRSEERYRRLVEQAWEGIIAIDDKGLITFTNPRMAEILDYPVDDLKGKPLLSYVPEKYHDFLKERLERRKQGIGEQYEVELIRRDGQVIYTRISASTLYDDLGFFVGSFGVVDDITKRKQAEKSLRLLEHAVESAIDGLVVVDTEGQVLYLNSAWAKMHQFSKEECLGQSLIMFHTEKQICRDVIPFGDQAMKNNFHQCEVGHRKKDGTIFPTWMTSTLLKDEQGLYIGFVGVARDISDQKQAAVALQEKEQLLRAVLDNSPNVIFIKDLEGRYILVNRQFENIFQIPQKNIEGKTDFDLFPPELAATLRQQDQLVLRNNVHMELEEIIPTAGQVRAYISNKFPLLNSEGKPYAVCGIATDITGRKQTETLLKQSEEKFRQLAENADEVFWLRTTREVLYISPAYERIWGRSCQSLYENPLSFVNAIYHEDRARIAAHLGHEEILRQEIFDEEYRIVRPDGTIRWIRARTFPIKDQAGQIIRRAGVAEDITVRKQAEEWERRRYREFNILMDCLPGFAFFKDHRSTYITANRVFCDAVNISPDDVPGKTDYDFFPPNLAEKYHSDDQRILSGAVPDLEVEEEMIDGKKRLVVSTRKVPVKDESGTIVGLIGLGYDISDRKLAENVIRRNEERLELALQGGDLGLWDWNIQTGRCIFNERWAAMLGYGLDEVEPEFNSWINLLHPEDIDRVMARWQEHQSGRTPFYEAEHRLKSKSGDWVWVLGKGKVVERDAAGEAFRATGTHLDITARKKAEASLQVERNRLRGILDSMPNGIYIVNQQHQVEYINPSIEKDFGPVNGRKCYEYLYERTLSCPWCKNDEVFAGKSVLWEFQLPKTGRIYELFDTPFFNEDGAISKLEIFHDITDRKLAEEKVKKSFSYNRSLIEASLDPLVTISPEGKITDVNRATEMVTGVSREYLIGSVFPTILPNRIRLRTAIRWYFRKAGSQITL
ncbi:MAG: PAS domain S-box protein [Deltaproteobacteria bacterium]|nr:PAS domain S-box protein [Deltaproteobacteria bacterium]